MLSVRCVLVYLYLCINPFVSKCDSVNCAFDMNHFEFDLLLRNQQRTAIKYQNRETNTQSAIIQSGDFMYWTTYDLHSFYAVDDGRRRRCDFYQIVLYRCYL